MSRRVSHPRSERCRRLLTRGPRAAVVGVAMALIAIVGGKVMASPSASSVLAGQLAGAQVAPSAAEPAPEHVRPLPPIKAPALRAVVTIAPLKSFVEPLLPEGSQLRVLMQPGKSEHGYEFTPSDLRALAEADVVVLVGLNLEPAVEKTLANRKDPSRQVVRFSDVAGIEAEAHAHADQDHDDHDHADHAHDEHGHDPHADCDHGPIDPHLWLDPILCDKLVGAVRAAVDAELTQRDALSDDAKAALAAREAELHAKIARVDQAWKDAAPLLAANPIVTHHNAFPRLAERYGLRIAAVIRALPTSEPSPAEVAAVARTIRDQNVRTIYVEPQFNRKLADRIAKAAGVSVATLDPLGTGDWFALMESNLATLRANATTPGTTESEPTQKPAAGE